MLTVYSDYIAIESLASFYVGTPDPKLNCPPYGQRLVISWSVPAKLLRQDDPHLLLTLRFKNREQIKQKIPLTKQKGTNFYQVINQRYCETGGFLSFQVLLFAGGQLQEEWRHQLWSEIITLDEKEVEEECEFDEIDFL